MKKLSVSIVFCQRGAVVYGGSAGIIYVQLLFQWYEDLQCQRIDEGRRTRYQLKARPGRGCRPE